MLEFIDTFLNGITTYRLTLYYLIVLILSSLLMSFMHILSYSPIDLIVNTAIAILACMITNYFFAKIYRSVTNYESVYITALILVLIIPLKFPENALFILFASVLSMSSKYILTVEKRHVFNPAAVSVAMISLLSGSHTATWWIGTPAMMPFVLLGGLLIARKIQQENMVLVFLGVYLFIVSVTSILHFGSASSIISVWRSNVLSSALIFFAFVMLTEPFTTPIKKENRLVYSIIIALFYTTPQIRLFSFALTPEIALCIGNIYSYIINPKYRLQLKLDEKIKLTADVYAYSFNKNKSFSFMPGQYMEWTLNHKNIDSRGNRRYFSLASSPTEDKILIEVKFYNPSSSFKKALLNFKRGEEIIASVLSGEFILPKKTESPSVFLAGGVGIAPFRSMIQYIYDKNLKVDIILIYINRHKEDITYADVFAKAENNGVKTIYVLTDTKSVPEDWTGKTGYISENMIKEIAADYSKRIFYISGPQLMVENFEKMLKNMGIQSQNIKRDFFPGYSERT